VRLLISILFSVLSVQVFAGNNHCSKEEKVVFSCAVNKKIVSICASQNLSPTAGYMQYRFGKIGAPELLIPQLNEHPLKHVQVDAYQAASGQGGAISFKNGEYTYSVHWSSYRSDSLTENDSSIWNGESGLKIVRKEKIVANFKCGKVSSGDVLEVEPYYLHTQVGFPENGNEGFHI